MKVVHGTDARVRIYTSATMRKQLRKGQNLENCGSRNSHRQIARFHPRSSPSQLTINDGERNEHDSSAVPTATFTECSFANGGMGGARLDGGSAKFTKTHFKNNNGSDISVAGDASASTKECTFTPPA